MIEVNGAKDSTPKSSGVMSASSPHISRHVAKEDPASTRQAESMLRLQDHQIRSDEVGPSPPQETRASPACPGNKRNCISDARTSKRLCNAGLNWFTLVNSSRCGPAPLDIIAQADDCLGFDLRDARNVHIQDGSDLPNVLTLPVVEVQDDALGSRQFLQAFLNQLLKLGPFQYAGWGVVFIVGYIADETSRIVFINR